MKFIRFMKKKYVDKILSQELKINKIPMLPVSSAVISDPLPT